MKASVWARLFLFLYLLQLGCAAGRDFYAILEISRDASSKQVKRAFHKLSRLWHPDKNKSKEAAAKFEEITAAYEVLSDTAKRTTYDKFGEEGLKNGGQQRGNPFGNFFNFGGRNQRNEVKRGEDTIIPFQVTLEDLYNGLEFELLHRKQVLCHACHGSGAESEDDVKICGTCKGTGQVTKTERRGPGFITQYQSTCTKCGGKGKHIHSTCPVCKGATVEIDDDTIFLFIERGMAAGQQIVFQQAGDEKPDEIAGDLIFHLVLEQHSTFRREGNDLHMGVSITLLQALNGFTFPITHLDGHVVTFKRTRVTIPGQKLVIENEGMPIHGYPSEKGNLYLHITVEFPESVTEEQKAGFAKLLSGVPRRSVNKEEL